MTITESAVLEAVIQALLPQSHSSSQKVTNQADRKQVGEFLHVILWFCDDFTSQTNKHRCPYAIKYISTTIDDANIFYCCHWLSQVWYAHVF